MADTSTAITPESTQAQLNQLKADFNIQPGEVDMLIMDIPGVPPQQAPIIMAQAPQPSTKELYGTVGACYLRVNNDADSSTVTPGATAESIFSACAKCDPIIDVDGMKVTVTVLQPPKHGTLDSPPSEIMDYTPNPGYVGNDKIIFLVDVGGYKIKVIYFVKVLGDVGKASPVDLYHKYCPIPSAWRISSSMGDATSIASLLTQGGFNLDQSNVTVTIADLSGGAVGETTGTSITLDTNAAGYGWYVDPNPAANTDFLPTSNPDVWMAKAGVDTLKNAIKSTFKVYILVSMLQHLEF